MALGNLVCCDAFEKFLVCLLAYITLSFLIILAETLLSVIHHITSVLVGINAVPILTIYSMKSMATNLLRNHCLEIHACSYRGMIYMDLCQHFPQCKRNPPGDCHPPERSLSTSTRKSSFSYSLVDNGPALQGRRTLFLMLLAVI